MKPIKFEDDEQEEEGGKGKKKKNKRKRCLSEEMITDEVEEDDEDQEEAGQEYLFFDIESRQDEGRHIGNLLIVQDEAGYEVVFKGDDCVDQFGSWLLDGTHAGAIVIAHNLRGYDV